MKKLSLLIGLTVAAWTGATVCQQNYHMQSAYQYILTGDSPTTLTAGPALKLGKVMGEVTVLHDATEYKMITDFDAEGTCDAYVSKNVTFATRKKGESKFSSSTTPLFIKLNSNQFIKPGWDEYWFAFAATYDSNAVTLSNAVGKTIGHSTVDVWYANGIVSYALRNKSTGALVSSPNGSVSTSQTYHGDSATIVALEAANFNSPPANTDPTLTLTTSLKIQLIKITYDSLPTPVEGVARARASAESKFQARQMGNVVLIQPGEKAVGISEPLTLYGMMGNRIASLHQTGYAYTWNGQTASGADAPTGVYFVQAGNRVLGKFFYLR